MSSSSPLVRATAPPSDDSPKPGFRIDLTGRTLGIILATCISVWLAVKLFPVLIVVVVALVMVGFLLPYVTWLERHGFRRSIALMVVALAIAALIAAVCMIALPPLIAQLSGVIGDLPSIQRRAVELLKKHELTAPLAQTVQSLRVHQVVADGERLALGYGADAVELIGYAVTTLFIAFYVIADRERVQGALYAVVPRRFHVRVSRLLCELAPIVGGYMRGQMITSALMATFTTLLLTICRVPDALALGVVAAIADLLPFAGVVLATTPAVLVALGARGPGIGLAVLCAMLAYEELESRVLIPRIYGRTLRLPAAFVILAIFSGWTLMGILGAILALPIAAAIPVIVRELRFSLPGQAPSGAASLAKDAIAEKEFKESSAGEPATRAAAIALEIVLDERAAQAEAEAEKTAELADAAAATAVEAERDRANAHVAVAETAADSSTPPERA